MAASLVQREYHTVSVLRKVKFVIAKNNLTQNNAYIYGINYTVAIND